MTTKTRAPRQTKRVRLQKRMDAALDQLAQGELVKPLPDAERAYSIKHALVQDTAQSTLLHGEYKRLNLLVADAYETVFATRCMDEFAGVLAQHYAAAGDDAKTVTYAMHAGDLAAGVYANAEAIAYYTQALDAAKRSNATTGHLIHLYTKRGRVQEVSGQFENALSGYEEMATFAQARQDRELELVSLMLRATLRATPLRTFEPALGRQLSDQALALAEELKDRVAETKILWNLQMLSMHTTQPLKAIEYGERALAIARALNADGRDMREQIAYILHDLTTPYMVAKNIESGLEVNAQAREMWRALDNKPMLADNLGNLAQFLTGRGEFERAIEYAGEGAAIASNIGNDFGVIYNKSFIAGSSFELGDFDAAWREGSEVIQIGKDISGVPLVVGPANLAMLSATLGAFETSQEFDRRARAGFSAQMPVFFRSFAHAVLARAACLRGALAQAAEDIDASHAETTSDMQLAAGAQLAIAEADLALAQHDPARAIAVTDPYIKILQELDYRMMLAELLWLRGLALMELGKADDAFDTIEQARATAEAIHQRRMLWQICATLSEMETARGNVERANAYRAQARPVLEFLIAHTPQDLRASFLSLPRVREMMA